MLARRVYTCDNCGDEVPLTHASTNGKFWKLECPKCGHTEVVNTEVGEVALDLFSFHYVPMEAG